MRGVVANPELPSDHYGYPLTCPYLSPKSMRFGPLGQQLGQSSTLVLAEARCRSGRRLVSQGLHALFSGTLHPLANGTFTNPQGVGYLCLFPALLFQLKGA